MGITGGRAAHLQPRAGRAYVSGDLLVLERDRTGALTLTEAHTRYGVLLNGRRLERPVTLEDMTFFSVANYYFYYRATTACSSRAWRTWVGAGA